MKLWMLGAAVLALAGTGHAQERTAAGSLDTQMTWSALAAKVGAASDKAEAVNSRVDQIVVCGLKGMLYAPGHAKADGQGCLQVAVESPAGTVCGAGSHSTEVGGLVAACGGYDPRSKCPAGYTRATVPIWGGKNGQSISYCFKK